MKFTVRQLEAMGAKRKGAPSTSDLSPRRKTKRSAGYTGFVPPTPVTWDATMTFPKHTRAFLEVRIFGLRLISELNRREHHMVTYRRKKEQQQIVDVAFSDGKVRQYGFKPPLVITMTRLATREIKDSDNLISSCKHLRDQVARVLGIDDGDKRNEWVVEQDKDAFGRYGVEIRIEHREEND